VLLSSDFALVCSRTYSRVVKFINFRVTKVSLGKQMSYLILFVAYKKV